MFFASDNGGPVAPDIMDALTNANEGHTSAYGADDIMANVTDQIRDLFESPKAAVYLVSTGSAANALALSTITQPWQSIYCHRNAHIEEDECGAPEFYTGGAKITLIEGEDGRMSPNHLAETIAHTARAGVHNVQKGPLSITNVTECGTVYTLDQIQALTKIAKDNGLQTHLDGARFSNALVTLGCTPAEMTWKSGIDVVSFGGTKNGCMGVEAVVFFDPSKAWEFELRRKRGGHLVSKHRYLSAQMNAFLKDELWLDLARAANQKAGLIIAGIQALPDCSFVYPPEANMIFAKFPRRLHRKLHSAGAYYYFWPFDQSLEGPDDELLSCRLVCNWATPDADIDQLLSILAS